MKKLLLVLALLIVSNFGFCQVGMNQHPFSTPVPWNLEGTPPGDIPYVLPAKYKISQDEKTAWENIYASDKLLAVPVQCGNEKDTSLAPSCIRRHAALNSGVPTYRYGVNIGNIVEATKATILPNGDVLLE